MSCSQPIDSAVLADYWIAALPSGEEEAVEEHLFECDECGDRLRETIALVEGVRGIAREGSLRMIVSDAFLRVAAEEGLRVRQYAPPAGGSVQCTVAAADDILIGRLAADLRGVKRVDLSLCDGSGAELERLADIPVAPDVRDVILQESLPFAQAMATTTYIARLIGFDEAGEERLIGEYTFHHRRSLPGAGV